MFDRIGLATPYETVDRIRQELIEKVTGNPKRTIMNLMTHELEMFSIDNLEQNNINGLDINGRNDYGLHTTAIKGDLCNFGPEKEAVKVSTGYFRLQVSE